MANGIVLNIDTTKSEFQNPMVQLRQGDGNYQSLSVTVTSNGEPFDLTGWTTTFMGTTAGGFKIVDTASVVTNTSQGEFTYTPTKAWGQDQGEFKNAYFKFTKADETASGASFRVNVLDAVDLTAEEAGNYISVVDGMINELTTDLNALQTSVNDLKTQNLNIKTTDNTWTGTNTFNKKIIAPAGVQGNADTATKLQTTRNINGVGFDGNSDITVDPVVKFIGTDTDLFTLSNGFYYFNGVVATNKPAAASNYFTVEVIQLNTNGFMRLIDNSGLSFWTTKSASTWGAWHQDADDSIVVHNTGTETVAGDKTFTGNASFTKQIDGSMSTKQIPVNDFKDIALNTIKYSGHWSANGVIMDNSPLPGQVLYGGIEVIAGYNQFSGIIVYSDYPSWRKAGTYVASIEGSTINWVKISNDATVVHNTGTETVAGDKTFTGNNTFTGQTSFWFKQIQWTTGIMQGTWYIQRIGNWVNAKFDMSANASTGTTTLSLPVGYRPLSPFVRELEQGGAGISQNGTVFISQSYTGSNAMTFSYPTNDAWPTA